ncbi:MAG: insulinase family protein [Phycisphaerales bacterium]|nr:insulinase family protein [Planctomycetota bacterium]MCH8509551.1 insulinase family protein [Phycisphaerales bacterium]
MKLLFLTMILAGPATFASVATAGDLPRHPDELTFRELVFEPPAPEQFRHELSNGVPVYMIESTEFPLVTITFSFKGGAYMEPGGKAGLAGMTGAMMRQGGTADLSPSEFDEEADFLAANISASVGPTTSSASINTLTANLDRAMELFLDMVREPGFDERRLEVLRSQQLENIRTRDDNGIQIALRELAFLMWGPDHFEARQPTRASLESITTDDMRAFHARIFHPGNLMIAVSGDIDPDAMLAMLEQKLSGWEAGEPAPSIPAPTASPEPGVYYYEKDQNQVQVLIAHRGIARDDPDAVPVQVMNDILGGSGFTSRITNRVRTQEGLAYTAGSAFSNRIEYPGLFMSYFFTKTPTTALATRLVFDEIATIQRQAVGTEELETIQNSLIETFPRNFESKSAMMNLFLSDERTGRDPSYWRNYRDMVRSVSPDDVQRVANEHLRPDKAVILIVGPWDEIKQGNVDSEADPSRVATMDEFGQARRIPTRDPETLEPSR